MLLWTVLITHYFPLHDKQVYLEIPAKESVA